MGNVSGWTSFSFLVLSCSSTARIKVKPPAWWILHRAEGNWPLLWFRSHCCSHLPCAHPPGSFLLLPLRLVANLICSQGPLLKEEREKVQSDSALLRSQGQESVEKISVYGDDKMFDLGPWCWQDKNSSFNIQSAGINHTWNCDDVFNNKLRVVC